MLSSGLTRTGTNLCRVATVAASLLLDNGASSQAAAEEFKLNVTYVCNGEPLYAESCNTWLGNCDSRRNSELLAGQRAANRCTLPSSPSGWRSPQILGPGSILPPPG